MINIYIAKAVLELWKQTVLQAYFLMKPTRVATPFPGSALVLRIDTRGNIWLYWGAACIGGGAGPSFFFVEPLLMGDVKVHEKVDGTRTLCTPRIRRSVAELLGKPLRMKPLRQN